MYTESDPDDLAHSLVEGWGAEDVATNGSVDDLDTDVAVEQRSDQSGDEVDGVAECLPCVGRVRNTLISRVEGVLSLGRVDNHAHSDVDAVNEDLGANETLPEVPSRY